jgi:hypothetical protein
VTPAALSTVRNLQRLGLPSAVLRKISIGADGKPDFGRLSDPEFDADLREVRRAYPLADPAQQGWG